MDSEAFKVLEYEKIKERLASFASSMRGKELCRTMMPLSDFDAVLRLQAETAEAVSVLHMQTPPFGGIYDVRHMLQKAALGSILEVDELREMMSTMQGMRNIKYFFRDAELALPILKEKSIRIEIMGMLEKHLQNSIDEHGNFRDDASPELRRVTRELLSAQNRVKERLSAILHDAAYQKCFQEAIVTVRDDRYVIPVKQEYRVQFPGVIHDQSASGATLFVEPLATVELNNTVRQMELAREQEIQRILQQLTQEIARAADILSENCTILAELDLIFARAGLSCDMDAYAPVLNCSGYVRLQRARHPLLPKDHVVPIDMELGRDFSILLITGPNTGGKTVTMKTLGILALMAQSGCFLPTAPGAELPVYGSIYADIGDEQSIEQSLSTFSAHTKNIVRILKKAGSEDLVLLDEVGAGTDPDEGAALARSIIEHLLQRRITVVATTHYAALKTYAYGRQGVMNASVEFDTATLRPTYRLLIGVPGASNAFSISRRLGLADAIVARARQYMDEDHVRFETVVNELEQEKRNYEQKQNELRARTQKFSAMEDQLRTERDKFIRVHRELLHKAREEANGIVREARRSAEETIKTLKQQFDDHGVKERQKAILEARERLNESYLPQRPPTVQKVGKKIRADEIQPGDTIHITRLAQEGTVLSIQGKELTVQIGGLRTIVKMDACTFVSRKKQKRRSEKVGFAGGISQKAARVQTQIDVRGMNVSEAELTLGKFIDDAFFAGLSKILIIHGKGTGALRLGIQDYLKHHPAVLSVAFADISEGGSGASVAELK
jgi:mutS2 family protein